MRQQNPSISWIWKRRYVVGICSVVGILTPKCHIISAYNVSERHWTITSEFAKRHSVLVYGVTFVYFFTIYFVFFILYSYIDI